MPNYPFDTFYVFQGNQIRYGEIAGDSKLSVMFWEDIFGFQSEV